MESMTLTRQQHPKELVKPRAGLRRAHQTNLGALYRGDCLDFLRSVPDGAADMIFADPPFNLGKDYGPGITDQMKDAEYLKWSRDWLRECVRKLAPGGTLFVFNLPRWLVDYGAFLNGEGMQFRHWIAMRMPKAYPRGHRMSPAHYGCLYYTKGEPKTFNRIRVPIETCRHCGGEIRDYGGHRNKMNPEGVNLMDVFNTPEEIWEDAPHPMPPGEGWTDVEDVWSDVPPVRHGAYKLRGANALAPIMLERLVAMATNSGDLVLDPFAGTGTTCYAAQLLGRRWLGVELGDTAPAIRRLTDLVAGKSERWETARGKKPRKRSLQSDRPARKALATPARAV